MKHAQSGNAREAKNPQSDEMDSTGKCSVSKASTAVYIQIHTKMAQSSATEDSKIGPDLSHDIPSYITHVREGGGTARIDERSLLAHTHGEDTMDE
ncbi:hypothetical protein CBR_g13063 [Chara braunii]|uniref:Uncharacterized protein n=1 Tax=Chara braunii TaxID=69332 RepID=A0A388KTK8_CHABU|nr:hypothetical protein CBR_g13063 [Chara braunii]|eukprot:GBG73342.1 hypothetical protein CBR_g13063 [Chara braunii]